MRRKKQKHTRRAVRFFRINHGFRAPYKVILDGNFVHVVNQLKRGDCKDEIFKLLGDTVRVFTTRCVMHELRSLGSEYADTRHRCKQYALHKCGHEDPVSATECLASQVENGNKEHFFIATQDRALQRRINSLPGGAVIYASVNGIHLDTPSETQRKQVMAKQMKFDSLEKKSAELKVREMKKMKMKESSGDEEEEEEEADHRRSHSGGIFRRNKAKGPNPLSIKKKKKPTGGEVPHSARPAVDENNSQNKTKPKRQRRKSKTLDSSSIPLQLN